jgi:formylglycine-generating enzyme required for sulfatase activity
VADRVYVAMEFVEGTTIDQWLKAGEPRTWRQILKVFVAAGRGLAAAHAAGIVHRDFKPQNVMLARDGSVRVMDFGLARITAEPVTRSDPANVLPDAAPAIQVTQAGTILGTPAYMAPEQFHGDPADARSDQFSFCVALYEALHGERPFEGDNYLSLSMNVTEGALRRPPSDKQHEVPVWIRRPLLRGLRRDPAARFATMDALIEALDRDPAAKRRRVLGMAAIAAAVVVSGVVAWQATARRRAAVEQELARLGQDAAQSSADARLKAADARSLRSRAFDAFDRADRSTGEKLWRDARRLLPIVDADYDQAERSLETASALDASRAPRRAALVDLRLEHLLFAEDFRLANRVGVLEERLAAVDTDGSRRRSLAAPGTLALRTTPTASRILLERYDRDAITGRRRAVLVGPLPLGPSETSLPAGSYRLLIDGDGRARVIHPIEISRGVRTDANVVLPAAATVPAGFEYVAPGTFWYGDADEQLRTQFLDAVPVHQRATGAFLIARHETTYQDWIAFLDGLPPALRVRHVPAITGTMRGALVMRSTADGWRLTLQPSSSPRHEAGAREPITYVGRNRRSTGDWLRFPIGGVSPDSAAAYFEWLRQTGRVPGARFCTEREWERAARGADDRIFPHGDDLAPDDANIDVTYDRVDGAYGPDEVGSHPASRSPFDIDDLAGNIMEIVTSDEAPAGLVIRGGSYYFTAATARTSNREIIPRSFRDIAIGLRVCADAK